MRETKSPKMPPKSKLPVFLPKFPTSILDQTTAIVLGSIATLVILIALVLVLTRTYGCSPESFFRATPRTHGHQEVSTALRALHSTSATYNDAHSRPSYQ